MNKFLLTIFLTFSFIFAKFEVHGQTNYLDYHNEIIRCEQLIVESKFKESIHGFDSLFSQYDFVYLRDCKLAAELCAYEKDLESGFQFLRLGISNGWTLKSIEKNDNLNLFQENPNWKSLLEDYDSLHNRYLERLNNPLINQVQDMYKKDQKKALGALFRIGQKSKVKYAEKKFAPHSEKQMDQLNEIVNRDGYPGEKLIGNDWKTSVIISHHNSISVPYNSRDSLYARIKPKLVAALKAGEISPAELAIIEDWRTAALNGHQLTSYGFLGAIPNDSVLALVNRNRAAIGMRSVELRNELIDIEQETGIDLYLPKDWQKRKITIAN